MATATVQIPHDVPTTLNYYSQSGTDRPYNYVFEPPAGVPRSNVGLDPHSVTIHDARGKEDQYSLDTSGFQYIKHTSQEKEFLDDDAIKEKYYKEVEEILEGVGAKRVYIFDHTIRRESSSEYNTRNPIRGPVERVHIDQTFEASVNRVKRHLGDDAERLLKGRVRIINVWRPIENAVEHHPLAVCDWRTLEVDKDLVSVRHIYPAYEGSTFSVRYNPNHSWHFLSRQTPEEVTLIKCYDSETDRARLTPHSAFADKSSPADAPHRQSIEVRALVFDTE